MVAGEWWGSVGATDEDADGSRRSGVDSASVARWGTSELNSLGKTAMAGAAWWAFCEWTIGLSDWIN